MIPVLREFGVSAEPVPIADLTSMCQLPCYRQSGNWCTSSEIIPIVSIHVSTN